MTAKGKKANDRTKIVIAVTVILVCTAFSLSTWIKFHRGVRAPEKSFPTNENFSKEETAGGPDDKADDQEVPGKVIAYPRDDFNRFRDDYVKYLDLSIKQQLQLVTIWDDFRVQAPNDLKQRLQQTNKYLTPEQQAKMEKIARQRIKDRISERKSVARRALPDDQYEIYSERLSKVEDSFNKIVDEIATEIVAP